MRRVDPDVLALPVGVLVAGVLEEPDLLGRRLRDVKHLVGDLMADAPGGVIVRRIDENVHGCTPHRHHLVLNRDLRINAQQPQHWQSLVLITVAGGAAPAPERPVVLMRLQERTHGRDGAADLARR